jgi:hypothetical protein
MIGRLINASLRDPFKTAKAISRGYVRKELMDLSRIIGRDLKQQITIFFGFSKCRIRERK